MAEVVNIKLSVINTLALLILLSFQERDGETEAYRVGKQQKD